MVDAIVRDFGGLRIDTTDWPLILMEWPEERVSETDFHLTLAYLEQIWTDSQRLGLRSYEIVDFTRMNEIAPASQRSYAGEWLKRNEALVKVASVGAAWVTPSAILRGVVTAITWIFKPPNPTEFFATRPQAYAYGIDQLKQGRVQLPERIVNLRARLAESSGAR
jgi:hypothetical protein